MEGYATIAPRNIRAQWPAKTVKRAPMTEDQLREAMMADGATKVRFPGGAGSAAQLKAAKTASERAKVKRIGRPDMLRRQVVGALAYAPPSGVTAWAVADQIKHNVPGQVASSLRGAAADGLVEGVGKEHRRKLWAITDKGRSYLAELAKAGY